MPQLQLAFLFYASFSRYLSIPTDVNKIGLNPQQRTCERPAANWSRDRVETGFVESANELAPSSAEYHCISSGNSKRSRPDRNAWICSSLDAEHNNPIGRDLLEQTKVSKAVARPGE
jgi:hypothetical protein